MRVYSVSYDLRTWQQPDYEGLIAELKKSPNWWHYLESTWLIKTDETADQLFQRLGCHIHKDDYLLVIEVVRNYSGWLPQKAWDWINENVTVPSPVVSPLFARRY